MMNLDEKRPINGIKGGLSQGRIYLERRWKIRRYALLRIENPGVTETPGVTNPWGIGYG